MTTPAKPHKTLILSRTQSEDLVTVVEVITAVDEAFGDMARGTAAQPPAISMSLPSGNGMFLVMPALADRQGLASVKLLADIPDNAGRHLPTQRSVLVLVSQDEGAPAAIIHGQIPTRIRTAATSAVASKYLSRPDSNVLGLIGAGALAVEHVRAHLTVRPIDRIVVWSRSEATVTRFAEQIAQNHPGLTVEGAPTPQAVFAKADIICTLTPSRDPIVEGAWFRPGQHINAVGAPPRTDHREIDGPGIALCRLFIDNRDTALHESGDVLLAIAEGAISKNHPMTELGAVVAGMAPGRTSPDQITLFNSVGLGIQDLAIGRLMVDAARARGIGLEIDLSS